MNEQRPTKADNPNGKTSLLTSSRLAISLFSAATSISSSGSKHIDMRSFLARPYTEGGKTYSYIRVHSPPPPIIELVTVLWRNYLNSSRYCVKDSMHLLAKISEQNRGRTVH